MTNEQRIAQLAQRVTELERQLSEKEAAAATTAPKVTVNISDEHISRDVQKIVQELRQKTISLSEEW